MSTISFKLSAWRDFTLPAGLERTMDYFSDFGRTMSDLPYLSIVTEHAPNQYRLMYSSAEAGIFHIAFTCDVQVQVDREKQQIIVRPLAGIPPVPTKITLTSMTGQGMYASQATFQPSGANTQVRYELVLGALVPKRLELRLVPDRVVQKMVEKVVKERLEFIINAFIVRLNEVMNQPGDG